MNMIIEMVKRKMKFIMDYFYRSTPHDDYLDKWGSDFRNLVICFFSFLIYESFRPGKVITVGEGCVLLAFSILILFVAYVHSVKRQGVKVIGRLFVSDLRPILIGVFAGSIVGTALSRNQEDVYTYSVLMLTGSAVIYLMVLYFTLKIDKCAQKEVEPVQEDEKSVQAIVTAARNAAKNRTKAKKRRNRKK